MKTIFKAQKEQPKGLKAKKDESENIQAHGKKKQKKGGK